MRPCPPVAAASAEGCSPQSPWPLLPDRSRPIPRALRTPSFPPEPPLQGLRPAWTLLAGAPFLAEPLACRGEEDCPPWSSCEDRVGRRVCCCGLGYHLHPVLGCVPAKVFPAQLQFCNLDVMEESSLLVTRQLRHLFQHILGHLEGYLDSPVRELNWSSGEATILHHFSAWVPVTGHEVDTAVDAFWARCQDSSLPGPPACDLLHYVGTYQGLNLCQLDVCDHLSTTCSFRDGLVRCSCRHGFFQAHVMDRTCTACESGFWLQNGTCIRCPFGFGGAGCQEPFLLALVVASCFAGLLLLLLLLLLLGLLLSGRAAPAQDPPVALPLSLHSVASSLPRAQLPWSMPESEEAPLGSRAHLALEDPDREGQHAAGAPRMKTFLGSQCPPPSAPLAVGGCSNLIFTGDTGEQAERNYF
ncbi:protein HEG homolog 1-like isoform 2-T2 [Liasis olivaceus]